MTTKQLRKPGSLIFMTCLVALPLIWTSPADARGRGGGARHSVNHGGGGHRHGGHHGYHPVARGMAVGVGVAVGAAIVGSIVNDVPPSCTVVDVNGIAYQECDGSWYQPQYSGSSVTYVVVNPPQ